MNHRTDNVDAAEIAKFESQVEQWWDQKGEFKALHDINPVRLAYIQQRNGLAGKRVLDVGCGGGLLTEAMAAAGASVTGIDLVPGALRAAAHHADQTGLVIDYQQSTAENWAKSYPARYDIVTCMELLEHVPRPDELIKACGDLMRPQGALFIATVNRTWLSRLLVIWLSEYVLGIVRKGTHQYGKFVKPHEISRWCLEAGLQQGDLTGLRYLPFVGYSALCGSTAMNYMMHFIKPNV